MDSVNNLLPSAALMLHASVKSENFITQLFFAGYFDTIQCPNFLLCAEAGHQLNIQTESWLQSCIT